MKNFWLPAVFSVFLFACQDSAPGSTSTNGLLLRNATIIDGNGGQPVIADLLIKGDTIAGIGPALKDEGAEATDLSGKTILPALISTHVHVGTLQGNSVAPEHYTRENILAQLKKYETYGVENIQVMGTDRPLIFETGLRDSSRSGLLPGARLRSAGYGFGVPNGAPPSGASMDKVFRPSTASQVKAEMDSLAALKPDMVKIWVDDFGRGMKKMDPSVYAAIISEAHKNGIRVTAHAYYLSDVRKLVQAGIDIIGHSIRDSIVDDAFLKEMKEHNVAYIPTLSLDEFAFIYARQPEWLNDAFFKASLEPGVYEMITSEKYREDLEKSPDYARNMKGFANALKNLKKIFDAGILVAMGTDSGATPLRAQGFSEHLELQLMVQAGLSPMQALTVATRNGATLLKIGDHTGTIEKGKLADLLIIDGDPALEIKNTRKIFAVYKAGEKVSEGTPGQNK